MDTTLSRADAERASAFTGTRFAAPLPQVRFETGGIFRRVFMIVGCLLLIGTAGAAAAEAGQRVSLRAAGGRFLRARDDGSVRAERLLPGEQETLELVSCKGGMIALKTCDARFLVSDARKAGRLRADRPGAEPDDRAALLLVPLGGDRFAMKPQGADAFVTFARGSMPSVEPGQPEGPRADQIVEIYHTAEIPPAIRSALGVAIRSLVTEELADKEYNKVRTRRREKHIRLPAPTRHDLGRTKKLRLLSIREEYHVTARLDGPLEIRIAAMPCLRGYSEERTGLVMFDVRASVPASGRVRYKIPDAVSASTGFRTVAELAVVGKLRLGKPEGDASLSPPEVIDLRVQLRQLELSNDLLQAARRPIEDFINRELQSQKDRLRDKANRAVRKAFESGKVRLPLARYLGAF